MIQFSGLFTVQCVCDPFIEWNVCLLQAYMVDYYMYSSHAVENDPPSHIGSSYILPSMMTSSEGQTIVPITSNKHHPIGQLQC